MSLVTRVVEVVFSIVAGAIFAGLSLSQCQGGELPVRGVCAHRGAMKTHPENTLPELREAVRLGAQMIEFDLQLTRDGSIVLMHDETVDRTTNGRGRVADLTLAQIRELDAGTWKGPKFAGTRVPTFDEVLREMPVNVWLNCHLKGGQELGRVCATRVEAGGRLNQACLAATSEAAAGARAAVPSILICNMERQSDTVDYARETIAMRAEFLQFRGDGEIPVDALRVLEGTGIRMNYFGEETPEGLRGLWNAGIQFPLVDDPEAALKAGAMVGIEPLLPEFPMEALPKVVDLRSNYERWNMPPKAQGRRNTCSVFVTVGAFEYALSRQSDQPVPLSEEFANWACNRIIGNTREDRGQFFHDLLKGFEQYGLCREDLMPYETRFRNTPPTDEARTNAMANREAGFRIHWIRPWSKDASLTDEQFLQSLNVLSCGWPVCAGSDHSRLFVGYVIDPELDGGGKFLTRDSGLGRYDEVTFAWTRAHVYDLFWVDLPAK